MKLITYLGMAILLGFVGYGVCQSLTPKVVPAPGLLADVAHPLAESQRHPLPVTPSAHPRGSVHIPETFSAKMLVLKDKNCSQKVFDQIGQRLRNRAQEYADQNRIHSFVEINFPEQPTHDQLANLAATNSCILGYSSEVSSFAPTIPREFFNHSVSPRMKTVFLIGVQIPALPVDAPKVVPTGLLGVGLRPEMTKVYAYPDPGLTDIATLNNQILLALANQADLILVGRIDPSLIEVAVKMAADQGATVQFVPDEGPFPLRTPASIEF